MNRCPGQHGRGHQKHKIFTPQMGTSRLGASPWYHSPCLFDLFAAWGMSSPSSTRNNALLRRCANTWPPQPQPDSDPSDDTQHQQQDSLHCTGGSRRMERTRVWIDTAWGAHRHFLGLLVRRLVVHL
eukprot:1621085-Rhodomonas_salina.1